MATTTRQAQRIRRHRRARARVFGTATRPRLFVFKSNQHIYAGLVDDVRGVTLASVSDVKRKTGGVTKVEAAKNVGEAIGAVAKEQGMRKIVFDRGGYKYHGRVKAVAEGARSAGLVF